MGQVKTLMDIVRELDSLDDETTIYAAEPWTADAKALVAMEPTTGDLPTGVEGMKYFIEVSVAREFLEGWASKIDHPPSVSKRCERLIRYAVTDA